MIYIGVDIGTSSVKLLAMDENGEVLKTVSREYSVVYTKSGWSEQNPLDWLNGTYECLEELLKYVDRSKVKGMSFGGQMHGLVILDEFDNVIRPCILWNDGRTQKETVFLNEEVGKSIIAKNTGNIAFAGFTAPKILWIRNNEPENFSRISKIMLPKDYVMYMLTGVHASDYSDASGMLLLDVKNKCFSKDMLEICDVKEEWLPKLYESFESVGNLKSEIAERFGLKDVVVAAGAGDNAAAAIGTGTVGNGECNISLGTSGTIFICSDSFRMDRNNALHSFAHADGAYHLMGCILSAASCGKWWIEDILNESDYEKETSDIQKLGENNIFFLPYLMGERSPHNDPNARGCFIGLDASTSRSQMIQAVYEGVAFALRDSLEVAKSEGIDVKSTKICGGGAKSEIWQHIIANVMNLEVNSLVNEEGPALGAAILAGVAFGEFTNLEKESNRIAKVAKTIHPDTDLVRKYDKKYEVYKMLYPALKQVFSNL